MYKFLKMVSQPNFQSLKDVNVSTYDRNLDLIVVEGWLKSIK